jgi:hypothetical protein
MAGDRVKSIVGGVVIPCTRVSNLCPMVQKFER